MFESMSGERQCLDKDNLLKIVFPKILERSFGILGSNNVDEMKIIWALTGLNDAAIKILDILSRNNLSVLDIASKIKKSRSWTQKLLTILFKHGFIERTWVSQQQEYFYRISSKKKIFVTLKTILDVVYREILNVLSEQI